MSKVVPADGIVNAVSGLAVLGRAQGMSTISSRDEIFPL